VSLLFSLLSPSTFDGAQDNLIRLLERNQRRHQELIDDQPQTQKGISLEQQMYIATAAAAANLH